MDIEHKDEAVDSMDHHDGGNDKNGHMMMSDATNAKPKAVPATAMTVSDEHKAPNLTIAVIHGARTRPGCKLSTAQGDQEPSIVLDHMAGSPVIVLMQCFAAVDLLIVMILLSLPAPFVGE